MYGGIVQGFISINVADARYDGLVQQYRLDRPCALRQAARQFLSRKLIPQWLHTVSLQRLRLTLARPQSDAPELTRVGVEQAPSVCKVEADAAITQVPLVGIWWPEIWWSGIENKCWPSRVPCHLVELAQARIDFPAGREQEQIA